MKNLKIGDTVKLINEDDPWLERCGLKINDISIVKTISNTNGIITDRTNTFCIRKECFLKVKKNDIDILIYKIKHIIKNI